MDAPASEHEREKTSFVCVCQGAGAAARAYLPGPLATVAAGGGPGVFHRFLGSSSSASASDD